MNEHLTISSTSHWRATESASSPIAGAQGGNLTTQPGQNLAQLSDEEFWNYARKLANQVPAAAHSEECVTCKLSRGDCLIPLSALYEVVRPPHRLALLPAIPEWMPGIVAWRGETIAVIDLDAYLSGYPVDLPDEGILLVASYVSLPVGLLVPTIGQTTPLQSQGVYQLPSWYLSLRAAFVKGMQGEALVLDLPLLLAHAVQQIETATSYG